MLRKRWKCYYVVCRVIQSAINKKQKEKHISHTFIAVSLIIFEAKSRLRVLFLRLCYNSKSCFSNCYKNAFSSHVAFSSHFLAGESVPKLPWYNMTPQKYNLILIKLNTSQRTGYRLLSRKAHANEHSHKQTPNSFRYVKAIYMSPWSVCFEK